MWNVSAFARIALGALLVTGSASVAGADIRLTESSLSASVRARVDPHTVDQTDAEADVPDPGTLRDMSANATASDSAAVSESVAVAGSVTFTGADTFTVHLVATRSGADTGVDEPGGLYFAHADFELSFLALADGVVTVGSGFVFSRTQTGTFTPLGIALESGTIRDARDPRVPFDDTSGTGGSVDQLPVTANRGYTLRIDVLMSGATSNLTEGELWDATFDVQMPPIVTDTSPTVTTSSTTSTSTSSTSTSTTSTVATIVTTTTTLPPTCADVAPEACTSPSLPRSIATSLKRGCSLFARAESASPARARRLHRRAARKLSATCSTVSRALEKGKISVECANGVRGTIGEFCG
jgi:hypothetical protein